VYRLLRLVTNYWHCLRFFSIHRLLGNPLLCHGVCQVEPSSVGFAREVYCHQPNQAAAISSPLGEGNYSENQISEQASSDP